MGLQATTRFLMFQAWISPFSPCATGIDLSLSPQRLISFLCYLVAQACSSCGLGGLAAEGWGPGHCSSPSQAVSCYARFTHKETSYICKISLKS